MNRIVALAWLFVALVCGYFALTLALGPKGDASGWMMALGFAIAGAYAALRALRESELLTPVAAQQAPTPTILVDLVGAWRGDPVPLEMQIEALAEAGLSLAPGRTIDDLLTSWPSADYETDPYNLILFMYGSDVEAEPFGRAFCERGWNFDMECLVERGDYVRALGCISRITGRAELTTAMSDTFSPDEESCEIRYTINGRERILSAKFDNDWADYEAVAAFVHDIETTIGDGRHFWAADNGQASILFFLTDVEASKVNALREDVLARYVTD